MTTRHIITSGWLLQLDGADGGGIPIMLQKVAKASLPSPNSENAKLALTFISLQFRFLGDVAIVVSLPHIVH